MGRGRELKRVRREGQGCKGEMERSPGRKSGKRQWQSAYHCNVEVDTL